MRRPTWLRPILFAPLLALISLSAWAVASPMGSSPDDDFHLTSAWCASTSPAANCSATDDATVREVPVALLDSACYLPDAERGAGCQERVVNFDPSITQPTQRGNFVGGYPPVFYAVMGLFVGPDILVSVLVMRLVNATIFVALVSALFALLPSPRRPSLVGAWLVTTIPLGIFLIPSNNPSSWALIGTGTAWLALLGWFETSGRRKVGLGVTFVVATLVAAGSRGDSAVYASLGIAIVLGLTFAPKRRWMIDAILPVVLVAVCAFFFLTAQQVVSGLNGFGGVGSTADGSPPDTVGILAFNLLNVPSLWAGVFGSWGLGWLEVGMPGVVALGSLGAFLVVASSGFAALTWRKAIALAFVGTALVVIPVAVLTRGADLVGQEVQPRYIAPLIVMLAGMLLLNTGARVVQFSRGQLILIGLTLGIVQFVALHVTMRRYVTGNDEQGWNLDAGIEWWWNIPVSPMSALVVGSLAYAALLVLLLPSLREPHSEVQTRQATVPA